jgi:hypothetical protein
MPQTGGRIGGYCHPRWIKAAEAREGARLYAAAIARFSKSGVSVDELDWGLMQLRSASLNTGFLKRSPEIDPVKGFQIGGDRK